MKSRLLRLPLSRLLVRLVIGCSLASLAPSVRAAGVWDLKTDWSDTVNPNGPWSCNEGANPLPNSVQLTAISGWGGTQPAWAETAVGNNFLPLWYRSRGVEPFSADILTGDIVVHTTDDANGVGNGVASVTWRSPVAGTVSISGGVWMTREIGRSNAWKLYKNAALLSTGGIGSGDEYNRANPFNFIAGSGGLAAVQNITVAVNDVIKLEIVRTSQYGDFAGVNFRIMEGHVWNTGPGATGNTYIPVKVPGGITWQEAEQAAVSAGGHLVSMDYVEENSFVYSLISADPGYWFGTTGGKYIGPWIGGLRSLASTAPGEGWSWSSGSAFGYQNWAASQPDNAGGIEDRIVFYNNALSPGSAWQDYPAAPPVTDRPRGYVIEIGRHGSSGGGGGTVWNTGPGANGHSYEPVLVLSGLTWPQAEAAAVAKGGHLAGIGSAEENAFVFSLVGSRPEFWYNNSFNAAIGPFIGGFQPDGSPEAGGGFQWSDGSPFAYTSWSGGEPNNSGGTEKYIHLYGGGGTPGPAWNDVNQDVVTRGYIIEYAATPGTPAGPEFADMLYVESQTTNQVFQYRVAPSGAPSLVRSLTEGMNKPSGLAAAPNGELFVVQRGDPGAENARLTRFVGTGNQPAGNGFFSPSGPPLDYAHGAVFRGGDLVVVDSNHNAVRRFQPNGAGAFTEQLPSITAGITGGLARMVTVRPATGEVLVSMAGGPNKILRYLISPGGAITSGGEITGNGIANPHGMTFSPWNELFVANLDGGTVSRFTFDAAGSAVPNGTITGNSLANPVSVAFSPWGELFVGNNTGEKVSRFTFTADGTAAPNGSFSIPARTGALQFVAASAPHVPPPCVPGVTTSVTDGLIGWWKGDGDAVDSSGHGNHGKVNHTPTESVTYVTGRFGQAFRVGTTGPLGDGGADTNPHVDLGFLPQLKNASAISMSLWIKKDSSSPGGPAHIGLPVGKIIPPPPPPPPLNAPAGAIQGGVYPSNARGFFGQADSVGVKMAWYSLSYSLSYVDYNTTISLPPRDQWVHIAGVWRASDGFHALYENGVLVSSTRAASGAKFPEGTEDLAKGSLGTLTFTVGTAQVARGSRPFMVDDVRLYTRDLTPEEIQLIASGGDFNTCPPPDTGIPPLTSTRVPAGVRLAWPSRFTGWSLESSPDLSAWSPVTGTPMLENAEFSLTKPAVPARTYFRLRRTGN